MDILIVLGVVAIICGAASAAIASGKGRDGTSWFIIGFLFGILGLGAALIVSDERGKAAAADGHEHDWEDTEIRDTQTGRMLSRQKMLRMWRTPSEASRAPVGRPRAGSAGPVAPHSAVRRLPFNAARLTLDAPATQKTGRLPIREPPRRRVQNPVDRPFSSR